MALVVLVAFELFVISIHDVSVTELNVSNKSIVDQRVIGFD